ncbi:MAG: hypothetical protein WC261_09505 [Synergistaceae bacterium]|jgi:hypothetical protein
MKLKKEELNELKAKQKLFRDALTQADALNLYVKVYMNNLLKERGLDTETKNWDVSLTTGKIVEKKVEAPKE